jgi:hypothetical protein
MMNASAKSWSIGQFMRMLEKGTITYSNIYQRSYSWDRECECNLIASYVENYKIPPITCNRHTIAEDGTPMKNSIFDLLNGKQRITATFKYTSNEFPISDLRILQVNPEDSLTFTDEEKELLKYHVDDEGRERIDINGLYFEQLPSIIQTVVLARTLTCEYYDDLSKNEERQIIINANRGKKMSTAETTRIEMKSFVQILRIAEHPVFKVALTQKAIESYWNEKLVEQTYMMLYAKKVDFSTKAFRAFIINAEMTEEEESVLVSVFDRVLAIYDIVKEDSTKVAKNRILGKTHMTSMANIIRRSIIEDVPVNKVAMWLEYFYSGKRRASIDEGYNDNAGKATATSKSIGIRLDALERSYEEFIVGGKEIPTVDFKPVKPVRKSSSAEVLRTVVGEENEEESETETNSVLTDMNPSENE